MNTQLTVIQITGAYKHAGHRESYKLGIFDGDIEFAGIVCVLGDGTHSTAHDDTDEPQPSSKNCRNIGDVCRIGAGAELWTTDGTTYGTYRVADINPGLAGSYPRYIVQYNNIVMFQATTAAHGSELWRSDGTLDGTVLVEDIVRGTDSSTPKYLLPFNGFVYFTAYNKDFGRELWFSDGYSRSDFNPDHSGDGTEMTADIYPGPKSSNPKYLVKTDHCMYFQANDGVHGVELWRSDGTTLGTYLLKDIYPGIGSSNPSYLTEYYDRIYFQADDGTHGAELWVTDGTFLNTYRLVDIQPGSRGSYPAYFTPYSPGWRGTTFHPWQLYFTANSGLYGRKQLWTTDGTVEGTFRVFGADTSGLLAAQDIDIDVQAMEQMEPSQMAVLWHTLYFPAREGQAKLVASEEQDCPWAISQAIVIQDVDCTSGLKLFVELKASKGRLTIDNHVQGLYFWHGTGESDSHLLFSGTLQQVNLALRGMTYAPRNSEVGYDTIAIYERYRRGGYGWDIVCRHRTH